MVQLLKLMLRKIKPMNLTRNLVLGIAISFMGTLLVTANAAEADTADLIVFNGKVFTADESLGEVDAFAVKEDRIMAVGKSSKIMDLAGKQTQLINAGGNFIMPGLIEGHGHFLGFGRSLLELDLMETKSWEEVVKVIESEVEKAEPGRWISGRGWHQEKWDSLPNPHLNGYPFHNQLSEVSPNNPVLLVHASGHALFANEEAMRIAGVDRETKNPEGGLIRITVDGSPIGVFEENAMQLIRSAFYNQQATGSKEEERLKIIEVVKAAEKEAFQYGITSFQDAGLNMDEIQLLSQMAISEELRIRLWIMLRENLESLKESTAYLPLERLGKSGFTSKAIKADIDGALGSYGALLMEPYRDRDNFKGQTTTNPEELEKIAQLAREKSLQLCVHAIGDQANRIILDMYENTFENSEELRNARWRIEHAQHLTKDDIPRFGQLGVIASMQGIHCTSDAPFVPARIGIERAKEGAYVWRSLIETGAIIANGTDVPVERINPFECLYASITRKSPKSTLTFFPKQTMTRKEALKSYTINNAYAAFEEDIKGSITPGKLADFVILDTNLMECNDEELLKVNVLQTYLGGELVYDSTNK